MLRLHKTKPFLLLCLVQSLVINSITHRKKFNFHLLSIICLLYGHVVVHLQKIHMYSRNSSTRKGKCLQARKEEDFLIAFASLSIFVDLSLLQAISYLLQQAIEYLSIWLLSASSFYPGRRGYDVARTMGEVKKGYSEVHQKIQLGRLSLESLTSFPALLAASSHIERNASNRISSMIKNYVVLVLRNHF